MNVLLVPDLPIERWPSMDRYASRLAGGLADHAPGVRVSLAGRVGDLTLDRPGPHGASRYAAPAPLSMLPSPGAREWRRYLARYLLYPSRVGWRRSDVVHVLDHSYAHVVRHVRRRTPSVVTVHDMLPLHAVKRGAKGVPDRIRNRLLRRVLDALKEADAWIVSTDWLRRELAEWLGADDRIAVVPFGVDEAFFAPAVDPPEETRRRWGIPETAFTVLHVGSVGPRKNFNLVIAAVDELVRGGIDAWLLQVGGAPTADQAADIGARPLKDRFTAIGAAGEADLRAAYKASDVLLFPSHYEGFGFPVLEAMAARLPVVTSGAGGLWEVSGDAAVIVGGREVAPYTAALGHLMEDRTWREELTSRGIEQAKRFRWAETARKTADVYERLA